MKTIIRHKQRRIKALLGLWLAAMLVLSACGSEDANGVVPTLVDFPTDAAPAQVDTVNEETPVDAQTALAAASTETPTAPSDEPTLSATLDVTVTLTPSMTITNTLTPTPSETPAPTTEPGLLDDLVALALEATILPPQVGIVATSGMIPPTLGATAAPACAAPPAGFGLIFNSDPSVRESLGCALGTPPMYLTRMGAAQSFQQGFMVWVSGTPNYIYVFYNNGTFQRKLDTFNEALDAHSGGEMPPSPNLFEPIRGFGKVWRDHPEVRAGLGWATSGESAGQVTTVDFYKGMMLNLATRQDVLVVVNDQITLERGSWRSVAGAP